jgi:hypothetical protein
LDPEDLVALSAIEAYNPDLVEDPNTLAQFLKSDELVHIFGQATQRRPDVHPGEFFEERPYWKLVSAVNRYKELRSGGLVTA